MSSYAKKPASARILPFGREVSAGQLTFLTMLALTVWTLSFYFETFASMIKVWRGSNTFIHGFLILPISMYMIWQKRSELVKCIARPSAPGFASLLAAISVWFLSSLASVQLGEHLGLIAIICASIWSVFGTDFARVISFPLLFAFFAVPFGEFLIPPLMVWTANFTVWALNLTGIPVFLEGFYFSLPSGNFEVVEACSGIRYLIVTVVLGIFFAYESFSTWAHRFIFVGCTIPIIIIANGIRAYLIVLVAHFSDFKYGTGSDHIYFGWILFALVITSMFWIGARVADRTSPLLPSIEVKPEILGTASNSRRTNTVAWLAIAFAVIASGPVLLQQTKSQPSRSWPHPYLPGASEIWTGPRVLQLEYQPVFVGAEHMLAGSYASSDGVVEIHEIFFAEQSQGNELVGSKNKIFDRNQWRFTQRIEKKLISVDKDKIIQVNTVLLANTHKQILLWYWYDVGGWRTTSAIFAKLYQAIQSSFGQADGDALLLLATGTSDSTTEQAAFRLESFLRDYYVDLSACLRTSTEVPTFCATDNYRK